MSIDVDGRPTLMDALTPVLDLLAGAGVRVTLDYALLNPPGALLQLTNLDWRFQAGDFSTTFKLTVITGDTDRTHAVANLSAELDRIVVALGFLPVTAVPVDVLTADTTASLPGMELTWTQRIRGRRAA
jgi:hypothetical protein